MPAPKIPKRHAPNLPSYLKPSVDMNQLLQEGLSHHQKGNLDDAKKVYEQILKVNSKHFHALQLTATLLSQQRKYAEALEFYENALQINPTFADTYNNRGNALKALKQLDEALLSYDKAIQLKPDYAEAYVNRGLALQELNRLDKALFSYDKAIQIKPDYAEAFYNRGITLQALKRHDEALLSYNKVIQLKPDYPDIYYNHGNALQELNHIDEALLSYDKAIQLKPGYAEAYNNRGSALQALKRISESLLSYDKAIQLKPDYSEAYFNRGVALQALNRLDESLLSYNKAIQFNPDYADAYNNRGVVLQELKRKDEALLDYDRAIQLKPDYAEAYNNRGITLKELTRLDEALLNYDKAIQLKPDYAEAYNNLGNAFKELKRFDSSVLSYNKAIQIKPDYAEAYWNKSLLLILVGEYEQGWQLYEWRLRKDDIKNNYPIYPQPFWLGNESLEGKTILVHAEQGLGDSIQFCRYLPKIEALKPKNIIFEVQKPLVSIIRKLDAKFTVVAKGEPLPAFDCHCPLMSLPLAFKTTVDTIPAKNPYLSVDEHKNEFWANKLGKKNRPRIGLVWSGSTEHKNDHNRSLQLTNLSSLMTLPFEFHCLQKEIRETDRKALNGNKNIHQHQNELEDFSDTAALMSQMDLIISVDTSVAHLAGALGKKVWILLPFMPDYRWMLDREDSPWYPSAKLFRQPATGDWEAVIENLGNELKKLVCKS